MMKKQLGVIMLAAQLVTGVQAFAQGFTVKGFSHPSPQYAPLTRWWWPGNDVTAQELTREINLLADKGFGGVEIQPFAMVLPTKGAGRSDRIMSYDSPSYYDNLRLVLETARQRGLIVDLTDGSGWPAGGPHLTDKDNNLTLEFGLLHLNGGSIQSIKIPRPLRADHPDAMLRAVVAAKVLKDDSLDHGPVWLDEKTATDLSSYIEDTVLTWQVPAGTWKVMTFWSMPDMERPSIIARRDPGFVMNHFDSLAVLRNYNYLFGERAGLQPYFGKPLRAVFDDSYEFRANRHFSDNFFEFFRQRRGYDVRPWLPANMWMGYNNMYARMKTQGAKPDFMFSGQDWRIRYDYDLTLGELLGEQFLKPVSSWLNSRQLLHRTQPYGFHMDVIATAGLADIPEMETMNSVEAAYKIISSGAHLYNRPIVSCETGVFINRAFMTTPQKLRMTIDKALAAGVNQVVYHGTPYRYFPEGYPSEGWYPFTNAGLKTLDFSGNISESDPYWKFIDQVNAYAARAQYALRAGKHQADVLLYFPFLDFDETKSDPDEILVKGVLNDVEPPGAPGGGTEGYHMPLEKQWYDKLWPVIHALNAAGITWDWVNDASIQTATITAGNEINIRGNHYQAIILANTPFIQLASARKLDTLAHAGASLISIGRLPEMQPGFDDYSKRDSLTKITIASAWRAKNTLLVTDAAMLSGQLQKIAIPVKYTGKYPALHQTRRQMPDGSILQFIWNASDQWQDISVQAGNTFRQAFWLNPENGSYIPVALVSEKNLQYTLPPYGSIFLHLQQQKTATAEAMLSDPIPSPTTWKMIMPLTSWHLRCDSVELDNTHLFDWRDNPVFSKLSSPGIYRSIFQLKTKQANTRYLLDLGKVFFTAEVKVNGQSAAPVVFAPYIVDVTSILRAGSNTIEIQVIPTSLNRFIAEAQAENKMYRQFKDRPLMAAGLKGPVVLYEVLNKQL